MRGAVFEVDSVVPSQARAAWIRKPLPTCPISDSLDCRRWQESLGCYYDRLPIRPPGTPVPYYYQRIIDRVRGIVEPGSRVLDIGCGTGELLASLNPSVGVGVDFNARFVDEARKRHAHLRFVRHRAEDVASLGDTFDYVLLSQVLGEIYDVQSLLQSIRRVCHAGTRLIVVHCNRVWQPALRVAEWLRIKKPGPERNWIPSDELSHLLQLSGFDPVSRFGLTCMPVFVPFFSRVLNRFVGNLPGIQHLGLHYLVIGRLAGSPRPAAETPSVSIVVPARNEAGTIRSTVQRMPTLAPSQEIIFVEGGSSDDTWRAISQTVREYRGPHRIRCMRQPGHGKADAVRAGFAAATGDVLMILDADLSVKPEELPRFYDALVARQGELINGSRMVYLMDRQAMRFLNLLANKIFGWLFTYLLGQRFRDTLCGSKVLFRRDYERIAKHRAYFGKLDPFGDFEILFGAARLGLKIADMPVHYKARTYGQTNISRFRHGWVLLRMCLLAARKLKFV